MLILRKGKPIRAVTCDGEARQMCHGLDSIVEQSAQSPMSHDWMDRLGMIRFEGTFKVRGTEIVKVTPAVIDLTLDDEPPVLALTPDAPAAADEPIPVGPSSDDEADAMDAASDGDDLVLSANSVVPV